MAVSKAQELLNTMLESEDIGPMFDQTEIMQNQATLIGFEDDSFLAVLESETPEGTMHTCIVGNKEEVIHFLVPKESTH